MKKLPITLEKEWAEIISLTSENADMVSSALGILASVYGINEKDLEGFANMVIAAIYSFKMAREKGNAQNRPT